MDMRAYLLSLGLSVKQIDGVLASRSIRINDAPIPKDYVPKTGDYITLFHNTFIIYT